MPGLEVLILGPYPINRDKIVGGVEAANVALADALVAHPAVGRVSVASFRRTPVEQAVVQVAPKLTVHHLRVPFFTGELVTRSWTCVRAVRPLVRALRPDIVHAQGIDRYGETALQLGLPAAVTVHGLVHVEARLSAKTLLSKLKLPLFERMVRRVLRKAPVVISISDYDARALGDMVGRQRISIPNAIGQEFFAQESTPPERPTLLFAGVLRPRKNVLGLVNAFAQVRARVPSARLVVAGPVIEPEYAAQVRSRVAELGLSEAVAFLGHVSNAQLVQAIHGCSALALFSNEETLPTIIAQALAVGRPVVASRVGGIPEMIVPGETGLLVEPRDEAALAAALIEVLGEPARAREMGRWGRAFARRNYEAAAVAQQTIDAYRAAIEMHTAPQWRRASHPAR